MNSRLSKAAEQRLVDCEQSHAHPQHRDNLRRNDGGQCVGESGDEYSMAIEMSSDSEGSGGGDLGDANWDELAGEGTAGLKMDGEIAFGAAVE